MSVTASEGSVLPGAGAARLSARDAVAIGAGIVGSTTIAVGSVLAALVYAGTGGERYDPLDHWVSELGELGVSALAPVFNAGLVVGGVCFAIFIIGLAAARTGRLRYAYAAVGVVTGVAGALVGVFPMNQREVHGLVALTFFDLGWITVALASVDIVRRPDPRFPRWLAAVGALTVAAFLAFIVSISTAPAASDGTLDAPGSRPGFLVAPTLEWAVIVGILGWVFLTSVGWWRAARGGER